jgi:hypothetical protein
MAERSMRGLVVRCGVVAASVVAVAAGAAAAEAASLRVTVAPATVRQNETYAIHIAGRFDRRRLLHGTPALLAFIQYTGRPCRATATAEYALPTSEWSWVFWPHPQRPESRSSFNLAAYERARTRFGGRRVCAYLYARSIAPTSTSQPLAIASAGFREVKR